MNNSQIGRFIAFICCIVAGLALLPGNIGVAVFALCIGLGVHSLMDDKN